MPISSRPKLPQLKTPLTSTFPSELSALSARSPLPGFADFIKQEEGIKTPITPPIAYLDFLKTMSPLPMSPLATSGDKSSGQTSPTSAPSTGSSDHSDCSCNCEHKSSSPTSSMAPPTPFNYPSSAPTTGRLGRLRIPPSPAFAGVDSPLSATATLRSPFSARSARSPFDWDFSTKGGRYWDVKSPKTRSSVRLVRETVTRTVTYTSTTPQMCPAPKGKRRKIE